MYLAVNGSAMISGLIVWWAIENMQPVSQPRRKPVNVALVLILGVFLTPIGVWVVSAILRTRRLAADIKAGGD
jgi:hypothetical protein